jgi:hypothetical protein
VSGALVLDAAGSLHQIHDELVGDSYHHVGIEVTIRHVTYRAVR